MKRFIRELNPIEVYVVGMSLFGTVVLAISGVWLLVWVGTVLTVVSVLYVVLIRRYLNKHPSINIRNHEERKR